MPPKKKGQKNKSASSREMLSSTQFERKNVVEYLEQPKENHLKPAEEINSQREIPAPVHITKQKQMIHDVFKVLQIKEEFLEVLNKNVPYNLAENSPKYKQVKIKFDNSFRLKSTRSALTSIQMLLNPYLAAQYKIKKLKKETHFETCEEMFIYRAFLNCTKNEVCLNNFNWRMRTSTYFDKRAISFRKSATKASNYLGGERNWRIMILSQVLIGRAFITKNDAIFDTVVPPAGHDTMSNRHGDVFVKYEDSDFYPLYIFHYNN